MAALRAPTIATTIHPSCAHRKPSRAASAAEASANGSANTECENLIIRP